QDVRAMAFSPDGKSLAWASKDRTVMLWDVAAARELAPFKGHQAEVRWVAFTADGRTLLSLDWSFMLKSWDVPTRTEKVTLRLPNPGSFFSSAALDRDGTSLVTLEGDVVRRWDLVAGKSQSSLPIPGQAWTKCFSQDGRRLAVARLPPAGKASIALW